jgi:hypothetical protein
MAASSKVARTSVISIALSFPWLACLLAFVVKFPRYSHPVNHMGEE